jgi:hypothetical protein
MRSNYLKATLKAAILAVTILLLTAGLSSAQTVNLTASQQTTTLPDGNTVPMWGWTCGTGTAAAVGATCTALTYNTATGLHNLQGGGWQPPLIVVPYVSTGTSLTINLTNTLPVETSLVIIGQAGGGLGSPMREAGPRTDGAHGGQTSTTWTTVSPGAFTPPAQGDRARSFVPEVAGVATVGGTPAAGTYTWTALKPGTYLIRTGTYPSIQGPMGLYGVLVVTTAPVAGTPGTPGLAYPVAGSAAGGVTYDADVVALESEIDARQNKMVSALFQSAVAPATANAGFSETAKWNAQCGAATNSLLTSTGAIPTCYPPAVDYTPTYFLIDGLAFSKDNLAASALSVPAAGATTGNVLVRYVNAGSHMHVPTVAGLNMLLVAEDGYVLPDVALALSQSTPKTLTANTPPAAGQALGLRIQDEVFQAAGKVFDVIVSPKQTTPGTFDSATYPTWDRSLALGTNSQRDGGMQAILDVNDALAAKLTAAQANYVAHANPDTYAYAPAVALKITSPGRGVIANDINVYGVQLLTPPGAGTVTLNPNGTFIYTPTGSGTDTFIYCANGTVTGTTCSSGITAMVTLNMSATATSMFAPTANPDSYTSTTSSLLRVAAPGVLVNDTDPNSYPLKASTASPVTGLSSVTLNPDGSFTAIPSAPCTTTAGCPASFTYQAVNSQGIPSNTATVSLTFVGASNLQVTVQDVNTKAAITDYKWMIEQDLTIFVDPACQQNGPGGTKPLTCPAGVPITLATNFHTSYMPIIAEGCTGPQSCEKGQTVYDAGTVCTAPGVPVGCSATAGQHVLAACDGYGICTVGASQLPMSSPQDAHLGASNPDGTPARYYISILPGDAQNAFAYANTKDPSVTANCTPAAGQTEPSGITETSTCGHTMGGAPIPAPVSGKFAPVTVNLQPAPLKTATVTAWVFEDDWPLNGEPDGGGGVDVLASQEPGLGDFQIEVWDTAGGIGDNTGQMTYDMFNVPLTNALNGTIDPNTGLDACPISKTAAGVGIGTIIVCPLYESDGVTLSPLTGEVVVRNLMQGKFGIIVHPGAAREAAGEEWVQTNSLDGGHFLDSFIKVGEPNYFQEYGPGGYHVFFAMANPKIINARLAAICGTSGSNPNNIPAGTPFSGPCNNTIQGQVTNLHQGRSPSEVLYGSGVYPQGDAKNYAMLSYMQCYASIGDTDGATIGFAKCDANGNFTFAGLPDGNYGVVIFDNWDDFILDGSSRPANVKGGQTLNLEFPTFTWQTHIWSNTYMDLNGNGVQDPGEPGLLQVPTRIRQTNGKPLNTLLSDVSGMARFDESFPAFAWYNVESDTTRFRGTGVHAVNDAGGQLDGPTAGGGNGNTAYPGILNSKETFPLPSALRVPGAYYCTTGDCSERMGISGAPPVGGTGGSTGRIDPGTIEVEGWQGGVSQFDVLDWGKIPYIPGETGGIRGHVVNATTRPFDDPQMLFQNLWEPLVPNVTINLYQEGTAQDGTTSLTLVDTTQTSSFDAWAQGFHTDPVNGVVPNMSCPGQDPTNDPFFSYTLSGTPNYLNPGTPLPNSAQYKCYDGYHNLNQVQPAPYDGLYEFPSATCLTPGATFTLPGNAKTYTCATITNPAFGQTGALGAGAKPAILPPAKYVTEVVLPSGWQLSKEEDLNLLIGDQYIAPAVAQFGSSGLGNIFITPDQASIDFSNPSYTGPYTPSSPYTQPFNCPTPTTCSLNPNTTNNGKEAGDYGRTSFGSFGPGGLIQQSAPCVGLLRIVPDYLSIAPESGEVAPFAGVSRNLCDRKEVTLDDQMQANADFFIYTNTPKTGNYYGFVSDDFSSEFDPAAPSYGEKFAVPNVPVSFRDFNGVEVSRMYTDQWGTFNGLVYSTWEVDPPNITGYSPNMMINCMNDPGPIPDPNNPGQFINDPLFNPAYSIFCYEDPFMPGDTQYLDTPIVPVSAFAEGYNPPDCNYPDATPSIKSVTGSDGVPGPWVSTAGVAAGTSTLTITALGTQTVLNPAYSGPGANLPPYNLKFVTRNYNFGTAPGKVTIGGVPANVVGAWSPTTLTVQVPAIPASISSCTIQQQNTPAGTKPARCGELVITAANGQQSIDTVTVTIGGKTPTVLTAGSTIQSAIDTATPGDMIIVPPGIYTEMLLMWKPIRLQGVGAASSVVNANISPAGLLLDPWRRRVACLFGLAINGGRIDNTINPATGKATNPYDSTGQFTCSSAMQQQVQRIPLEAIVGWDATLNGNLAELLQEPTLMGAYEGAAITVLGQGVRFPAGSDQFGTGSEAFFPPGTVALTDSNLDCSQYPGNFLCNPSRIDGMSFTNSSQGGGGIWLHGWQHFMEVSNNRVFNNGGTLSGAMTIGQPETPDAENGALDGTSLIDANGTEHPYLYNMNVHVHNNSATLNASYGDELGSNTPAAAGGVTFCTGSDYYKFDYNWVCGNLSSGNGGGFGQFGFNWNPLIEHNSFVFNQSVNPTLTTYGGGVVIEGVGPDGFFNVGGVATECGSVNDLDCPPGLSDGTGPGMVINANLFQGNTAEEGSGGGIEFQHVNGSDVQRNPSNPNAWYQIEVRNNIFVNNVAGWAGGGVSLHDAVLVNFINNTVSSNDTTASAGVLFDSVGAPNANQPPPGCDPNATPVPPACTNAAITQSNFEPAGLATELHTANFLTAFTDPTVQCPKEHAQCTKFSNPMLHNDLFWQNRAFRITTPTSASTPPTSGGPVQLVPALNQTLTGACPSGAMYWDIGVYTDTAPNNHASGLTLDPDYSVLTDAADYSSGNNLGANPNVVSQFCNGSRVPPEIAPKLCTGPSANANAPGCIQPGTVGLGITVPGGVPDSTNPPLAVFTLTPAATVDEGSNWINMFYGPLSLTNPTIQTGGTGYGVPLGNYALNGATGSPAIDYVPVNVGHPSTDFFGNPRPDPSNPGAFDIGAIEFQGSLTASGPTLASITPASGLRGTSVLVTLTGTNLLDAQTLTVSGAGVNCTVTGSTSTTVNATCAITATAGLSARSITVTTPGGTSSFVIFTVVGPTLTSIAPSSGARGTAVPVTLTGIGLTGATSVNAPGSSNITVTNFVAVNATTVTATLNLAAATSLGGHNITVTTPIGTTSPVTFTVTGATVAFTAPTPLLTTGPANTSVKNGTITVSNSATGANPGPLTLTATPTLVVTTVGAGSFSIVAGGTCVSGAVINPGGNCTILVRYTPTGTTASTAHVALANTGAASSPLSGPSFNAN